MKNKSLKYLLFVNLFSLAGFYVFAPLYAIYAHRFVQSPRTISLIWSGYSLAIAVLILIMGKLENRSRKGRMVVLGYFLYAVGAMCFLLVHNEESLIIVLLFNALGGGVTLPAYMTLSAKNEIRGRESEQWSWLDAGNMFAAAIGAGIGGIIVGTIGFRGYICSYGGYSAYCGVGCIQGSLSQKLRVL